MWHEERPEAQKAPQGGRRSADAAAARGCSRRRARAAVSGGSDALEDAPAASRPSRTRLRTVAPATPRDTTDLAANPCPCKRGRRARWQGCRCFPAKSLPDGLRRGSETLPAGFPLQLQPPTLPNPALNASMALLPAYLLPLVRNEGTSCNCSANSYKNLGYRLLSGIWLPPAAHLSVQLRPGWSCVRVSEDDSDFIEPGLPTPKAEGVFARNLI